MAGERMQAWEESQMGGAQGPWNRLAGLSLTEALQWAKEKLRTVTE